MREIKLEQILNIISNNSHASMLHWSHSPDKEAVVPLIITQEDWDNMKKEFEKLLKESI